MRVLLLTTYLISMISIAALSFVGCSGGGGGGAGSSGNGLGTAVSSTFIDAPVKGLAFTGTMGSSGLTGENGVFTCKNGEIVNFKVKSFSLGQAACGDKIFVQDLFAPIGVSNFHWNKAASVLQSLATSANSQLDLSTINAHGNDLSTLSYGASDVTNLSTAASFVGVAYVAPSAAESAANAELISHSNLDTNLVNVLEGLISNSSGKFLLKASLASGTKYEGKEMCDSKVDALMKVEKVLVAGKDIYTIVPERAISYNDAAEVQTGQPAACKNGATQCFVVEQTLMQKIITGTKFNVAASAQLSNYRGSGVTVLSNIVVSMSTNITGNTAVVSGTFYNKLTPASGGTEDQKTECTYNIDVN